jgi:hypothetical protein
MTDKIEEEIREQVENIIKRCKKLVDDFDQKGITADLETKRILRDDLERKICNIDKNLIAYKVSLDLNPSEEDKNKLLKIIKTRKNYLKKLKDCRSALLRIH